jgi:small subunit ribosomal protein S3
MGQKVNPIGMRLQVNRTWDSRWFANTKDYGDLLLEDLRMREFIHEECKAAGVSRVVIERPHKKCRVTIHTARPGVIIGKKGADIETLRKKLSKFTASELHLNIVEVRKPELDAHARTEWYREGRVPLHTLRADIDYALSEAETPYGIIGVKVWIFKGEIMEHDPQAHDRRHAEAQDAAGPRPQRRERERA